MSVRKRLLIGLLLVPRMGVAVTIAVPPFTDRAGAATHIQAAVDVVRVAGGGLVRLKERGVSCATAGWPKTTTASMAAHSR